MKLYHKFAVHSDYDRDLIRASLVPRQVTPDILAQRIPGERLHIKSLDAALQHAKIMLRYITSSLQSDVEWSEDRQDTFGFHLSTPCSFIAGALDGMALKWHWSQLE